jgi:pseudouridine-5'-phosphate glycosidase
MLHPYLDLAPEVAQALQNQQAIVALESTIISHGMPYPQNVQTALQVEQTVRDNGAIPATIAIMQGRLKVGLSHQDIDRLGQAGHAVHKVSRRDLATIVAKGEMGATTVATTMLIAHMAGIKVFATGGIGGVHRGAERSMDISADLQELARTPVAVVCAGAKSILDIGLTLEYLETMGVPVIAYQSAEFPAFFSQESGFSAPLRAESPAEIASVMLVQWALGLSAGLVVANPIPKEHAMPKAQIDAAIEQALSDAQTQGIHGKAVTPFLLERVNALTGGNSLSSNIALVMNNAALAAQMAREYQRQIL